MKYVLRIASFALALTATIPALSQAKPPAAAVPTQTAPPLQLRSLAPDAIADPFPPVNPKFFTTDTPSVATVDSYLHAVLGYDVNRIWRVEAIQKTAAPGVSKVIAFVSEKAPNAKVQRAEFFVLPDGKHLIADSNGVVPFGADPYAANRALLQARADGPYHGADAKDLMLVEFADLQCPHCKDAQPVMKRLAADFPRARIVYENDPLTDIHPFAFKAAAYGVCIAKKSNEAFFNYIQAVYDTQSLLAEGTADKALGDAASKGGADPAAVAACAATPATKAVVDASSQLASDLGIEQTPMLMINGRIIPIGGVPYETLREIIIFQAQLDGVAGAATTPNLLGPAR